MKETKISVTEASRNFADCVNRVRYQDASFVLLKNDEPVAKIVPAGRKSCTGPEVADILAKVRLSAEELRSWREDLKAARESLLPQPVKWK